MERLTSVNEAIRYTEEQLFDITGPEEVAGHVCISSMYLQTVFQVITGYSIGEYIRNRRLYRAALEMASGDGKIIDVRQAGHHSLSCRECPHWGRWLMICPVPASQKAF